MNFLYIYIAYITCRFIVIIIWDYQFSLITINHERFQKFSYQNLYISILHYFTLTILSPPFSENGNPIKSVWYKILNFNIYSMIAFDSGLSITEVHYLPFNDFNVNKINSKYVILCRKVTLSPLIETESPFINR